MELVEDNQKGVPRQNSVSGIAHLALIIVVVAALGVVGYLMLRGGQVSQPQDTTPETETADSSPTPDPAIADWKTYTNNLHGFSFKYPNEFYLEETEEDSGYKLVYLDTSSIQLPSAYGMGMITPFELNILNDISDVDEAVEGARTMFKQGQYTETKIGGDVKGHRISGAFEIYNTDITLVYLQGENEVISIEFQPNSDFSEETFNQILSTFEFTDPENSTAETDIESVSILETNNWKGASINGISFKIPPDYTCRNLEQEENYQNCRLIYAPPTEVNGEMVENVIPSRITVEDYQGGSRRRQFDPDNLLSTCDPIYKEARFGQVTALQIAIDGSSCQGGGGGIVAVVGDKLVTFRNLNYNTDTGKIIRWQIRDTIVSTFRTDG